MASRARSPSTALTASSSTAGLAAAVCYQVSSLAGHLSLVLADALIQVCSAWRRRWYIDLVSRLYSPSYLPILTRPISVAHTLCVFPYSGECFCSPRLSLAHRLSSNLDYIDYIVTFPQYVVAPSTRLASHWLFAYIYLVIPTLHSQGYCLPNCERERWATGTGLT